MTKEKLAYNDAAIVEAFSDKKFLLQGLAHATDCFQVIEGLGLKEMLALLPYHTNSLMHKRIFDVLKKQNAHTLSRFIGLSKWSSQWWAACIECRGVDEPRYLLYLGWHNTKGSQHVVRTVSANKDEITQEVHARVKDKTDQGYTEDINLKETALNFIPPLPSLDVFGLPTSVETLHLDEVKRPKPSKEEPKKKDTSEKSDLEKVLTALVVEDDKAKKALDELKAKTGDDSKASKQKKAVKEASKEPTEAEKKEKSALEQAMSERKRKASW